MARIEPSTFRNWNDGDTMNEADYEQEREILRTAVNDNYDRILTLENASAGTISKLPSGAAFPSNPTNGFVFLRTDEDILYYYTGSIWKSIANLSDIASTYATNTNVDTVYAKKTDVANAYAAKAQEALIPLTLQNGWVTYQVGMEGYYYKDTLGRVHLQGRLKNGTSTDGTLLAVLPVGYRPVQDRFITARNCTVLISGSGNITLYGVTSPGDTGIDNISFRSA